MKKPTMFAPEFVMNFQSKNKPIMLGALMPDDQLPEWSSLNTSYVSGEETKREA